MEEEGYLSHVPLDAHGQLWRDARRVVMSLWFQNTMYVLACTYLTATSIEIVLEFYQVNRHNVRVVKILIFILCGINIFIMLVFFMEILVRATLCRDGFLKYFADLWNSVDTLLIFISAVFEIIDLLRVLKIKWLIPILATMRLISSLRTIGMMYRKLIYAEMLINELLEDTIHQLNSELDLKHSDTVHLDKELIAKREKILLIENENQVEEANTDSSNFTE